MRSYDEGCGHMAPLEKADEVAEALLEFISAN